MDITGEITLIGVDDDKQFDFSAAAPGDVRPIHQTLYESADEDFGFDADTPVGVAAGFAIVTHPGVLACVVTLTVDDEHTMAITGIVPVQGGQMGNAVLAVTGGTGAFDAAGGRCELSVNNPKKYHIILG